MDKKNNIVGNYSISDIYTEKYANGVFGGFNGKDFMMNFFTEKPGVPHQFEVVLNDAGQPLRVDNIGNSRVREVHTAIIVNYDVAKSIHDWLGKSIQAFEEMVKKAQQKTI